ncbi:MAG: hypothetical protein QOC66_2828 [Pseudonocardiales bacterium]|jgi:hypothetical protein|nr:hypothetical protein [Pseudonocardiales bacterium]
MPSGLPELVGRAREPALVDGLLHENTYRT